jgi:hypothetical protein
VMTTATGSTVLPTPTTITYTTSGPPGAQTIGPRQTLPRHIGPNTSQTHCAGRQGLARVSASLFWQGRGCLCVFVAMMTMSLRTTTTATVMVS